MKKCLLVILAMFSCIMLFAQHQEDADKMVDIGVQMQDRGAVDSAIEQYQKALELDKNNLLALAEMAYSLLSEEKYNDAIAFCEKAIKYHKGEPALKAVYVTYGTALDNLKKPSKAVDVYNAGIKLFPNYYQLYFNKGITLNNENKMDEAILCFQQSASLNPKHPGSHNALGHALFYSNRVPSMLAYCRFLILEPDSKKSVDNLSNIRKILIRNIQSGGKTITINSDVLNPDKKEVPNNFSLTDLAIDLAAASNNTGEYKDKTEIEQFIRNLQSIFESLKSNEKNNYGFYWDYYAPYFIEMYDKDLVKTFAYLAFYSTQDKEVVEWVDSHPTDIKAFYEWSESFKWRIN